MSKIIKVEGMSCNHCVNAIETSVGQMTGVSTVSVNLEKGDVTVEFDAAKTSITEVKETIEDQGFDVKS